MWMPVVSVILMLCFGGWDVAAVAVDPMVVEVVYSFQTHVFG